MEMIVKRYFWVLQLVLVLVIALLGAMAVSNVISGALSPLLVTAPPSKAKADNKPKATAANTLTKLDDKSWTPPPKPPEPKDDEENAEGEEEEAEQEVPLGEGEYPLSDLKVQLNGTMVAADPKWSMAMLQDKSNKASFFVNTGERFMEDVEVRKIERDRIVIQREGRLEQIDMENDGTVKPTSRSLGKPSTKTPFSSRSTPAKVSKKPEEKPVAKKNDKFSKLRDGITKNGDSSFTIDKNVIKEVLTNPAKYRDGTKPVPNYVGGKPNGFKLVGMKPGSIYYDLGIQPGDVITSVNGKPLTSPNVALDFYSKFNSGQLSNIKLGVERGGKNQTLDFGLK